MPFPTTWFAARSALLSQVPRDRYPLVVKPNNGSSCEQIFRVDSPEELDRLDIDDSGFLLAQPYLTNPGYDVKLYNTGDEVFAAVQPVAAAPGRDVVEQQIPVTPELRALAPSRSAGRSASTSTASTSSRPRDGWVVLDVNDFPSFGKVPDVAQRLARTVLRLARRAAAAQTPPPSVPRVRSRHGGISMNIVLLAESSTNPVLASVLARLGERHTVTVLDPQDPPDGLRPATEPRGTTQTCTC